MNGWMFRALVLVSLFVTGLAGCKKEQGFRKETIPVTGQIFVDGKPAANLKVDLHDEKGFDKDQPTQSTGMTDADGKFAISTYENGDGAPEGDYALTFMWGDINMLSMQYGGPDKLNNRYNDPKESAHKIRVVKGTPTDLGKVELTTK